ncbi:hypothetical protein [Aeromonas salmonicida]|uniref:hypothetical protein n=1 Tax=Aeromonas salmonicida TaxID=645 RepID=UPI0023AA19CC|nr:hypothetical protein [Aeromonas salmonicida]
MKRFTHDADLRRMVVLRSLGFQLVPFKLHRFRKQRLLSPVRRFRDSPLQVATHFLLVMVVMVASLIAMPATLLTWAVPVSTSFPASLFITAVL